MNTEHYAYQIALKTLKERCSYLQNKLASVEEENCRLKLQISQDMVKKYPRNVHDVEQLHEQIALLTDEKEQLKHQVQLITAENQRLWSRLSKLSSSGNEFEESPLKCFEGKVSYTENHSDLEISKIVISPECNRESLEEISLKVSGVADKPDALDLKTDSTLQMENYAFSLSDDAVSLLNAFKNHIVKLKQFKQVLLNNKTDLTNGLMLFKSIQNNSLSSKFEKNFTINCDSNSNAVLKLYGVEDQVSDLSTLQVHDLGLDGGEEVAKVPDKMCPLCRYPFSGSFQEFHQHVSDHFLNGEPDVSSTFEILSPDTQTKEID